MKRRQFLILPAAALAKTSPSDRIALVQIGAGWQGMNNLESFLNDPRVRVVGVCDIDRDHLAEAQAAVDNKYGDRGCSTFHLFEDALARRDVDAVSLALPDHWHGIVSTAAARAGKDIYGEKPLAHNYAEGQAIRDAVRRYGRVWQTGSWQRSRLQFRLACELVRNGRIGKVHRVEVGLPAGFTDFSGLAEQDRPAPSPKTLDYDRWLGPAPVAPYSPARVHKNWRWNLDYGGGNLMDWVGHHVDIAHWGLGLDEVGLLEVEATGEFPERGRVYNAMTRYRVTAAYPGGLRMVIAGGHKDIRFGTKWIGEDGWIWVDRSGLEAHPAKVLTSRIGPSEIQLPRSPGHTEQFIDCVKTRGVTLTPAEVALHSATPGWLGLIAMTVGRKLRWDAAAETIVDDPGAAELLSRPMRSPWHV
jgi:predicted dehydrogenase